MLSVTQIKRKRIDSENYKIFFSSFKSIDTVRLVEEADRNKSWGTFTWFKFNMNWSKIIQKLNDLLMEGEFIGCGCCGCGICCGGVNAAVLW